MNPTLQITEIEQIISKVYDQFSNALKENYLHPFKQHCEQFHSHTKRLNDTILCIPEQNKFPIELHINSRTLTLTPPQLQPFQTITQNYLEKLDHLLTGYTLLEHCASETIKLHLIQGYTRENGTPLHSTHLLFLLPAANNRYLGYELQQHPNQEWEPTYHSAHRFEKAIKITPLPSSIFLVDNPRNLPLKHTVDYIIQRKYEELMRAKECM